MSSLSCLAGRLARRGGDDNAAAAEAAEAAAAAAATAAAPAAERFEVYVAKEDFKFSSSHFVAFEGFRERLHGHNYSCGVRLRGEVRDKRERECERGVLRRLCVEGYDARKVKKSLRC